MSDADAGGKQTVVPTPSTGPETPRVNCQRCGGIATNHYEGDGEHLDLCDGCLDDLDAWLRGDSGE